MRVVIIEDEKPAAEKLRLSLIGLDPSIDVVAVLHSLGSSVAWLQNHIMPDLIFMDIELTDGLSFSLFEKVPVTCPVIFVTAYHEYWQEAFEHNSLDYLLKPVSEEKLAAALRKYDWMKGHFAGNLQQLLLQQREGPAPYKKRYLVKRGTDFVAVKTEDIAYLFAIHKLVCMVDVHGQKFILDKSLTDLEKELDPAHFFRINRKYLVHLNAVKRIRQFAKGKLQIDLHPPVEEEVIISQETVAAFKAWIDG